ncbi:MAG TPA: patatin-like phospholipase family protein [Bryobacteraceae bacterium]|nr:patatin-like phospholipase family protein [Bryobacteraceae bacterium]
MALFDVVFEGGGAKGSAFVGALTALHARGHALRRLIGTSAGAITATLLAAGYSPEDMLAAVNEKLHGAPRFASFMDHPQSSQFTDQQRLNSDTLRALRTVHVPLMADEALLRLLLFSPLYVQLFSFVECGGFYAGAMFVDWLAEKLAVKGITAADTLSSAFAKTKVDLSVVSSDTTEMEMLVLNHRTAPDLPLVWAVRASMSIPFIWREVVWQESWGCYRGRPKAGHILVDGGVLSNFPIRLIAAPVPEIMGDTDPAGALNLGLLLDEKLAIPGTNYKAQSNPLEELHVVGRITRIMDTMMGAQDNTEMRAHTAEICRLPVKGYGTTEFDMPDDKLKALVDGGSQALLAHLNSRGL